MSELRATRYYKLIDVVPRPRDLRVAGGVGGVE